MAQNLLIITASSTLRASETVIIDQLEAEGYIAHTLMPPGDLDQADVDSVDTDGIVIMPGASASGISARGTTIYAEEQPKPVLSLNRGAAASLEINGGHSARSAPDIDFLETGTGYGDGLEPGVYVYYRDPATLPTITPISISTQYVTSLASGAIRVAAQPGQLTSTHAILPAGALGTEGVAVAAARGFVGLNDSDGDYIYLADAAFQLLRGVAGAVFGPPAPEPVITGSASAVRTLDLSGTLYATDVTLTQLDGPTVTLEETAADSWVWTWEDADETIVLRATATGANGEVEQDYTIGPAGLGSGTPGAIETLVMVDGILV